MLYVLINYKIIIWYILFPVTFISFGAIPNNNKNNVIFSLVEQLNFPFDVFIYLIIVTSYKAPPTQIQQIHFFPWHQQQQPRCLNSGQSSSISHWFCFCSIIIIIDPRESSVSVSLVYLRLLLLHHFLYIGDPLSHYELHSNRFDVEYHWLCDKSAEVNVELWKLISIFP